MKLAKKCSISIRDLIVSREDGKAITINEGTKVGDVPYFVDGAILKISTKNPKK